MDIEERIEQAYADLLSAQNRERNSDDRLAMMARMEREELADLVGMGFHAALRRAAVDSPKVGEIHHLIGKLPDEDWNAVVEFVTDALLGRPDVLEQIGLDAQLAGEEGLPKRVGAYAIVIVASDRHGYGHEPARYDIVAKADAADDLKAAEAEARDRYGKATGLDDADISVSVVGVVEMPD